MEVVLFLAILAATLAYVGWPLLQPALAGSGPSPRELRKTDLLEEKERLLGALRDLEHDHQTGKIDDADHAALASKLKTDAARVLKEIDVADGRRVLRPGDPVSPPEAAAPPPPKQEPPRVPPASAAPVEASYGETRFCTKCGKEARPDDAFCGRCGNKIG